MDYLPTCDQIQRSSKGSQVIQYYLQITVKDCIGLTYHKLTLTAPSANSVSPFKIAIANRHIHAIHKNCIVYLFFITACSKWGSGSEVKAFHLAVECMKWLPDMCIGESFSTSKINKMSS